MTPRHTHLALATLAVAALLSGVAALRYMPGLPGKRAVPTLALSPPGGGPLLHGLRSHLLAQTPAAPQAPISVAPDRLDLDAIAMRDGTPVGATPPQAAPAEAAEAVPADDAPEGVQGAISFPEIAPTPPQRPTDFAKSIPLPPARPANLAELTSEETPAEAPRTAEQRAPILPDAPPPPRPVGQAAKAAPEAPQAEAAAPPTQVARAVEPTLRPAPDDAFDQQAPIRFGMGDQVFVRIFKKEGELELWLRKGGARFSLYKSFPICKWSGRLGPKLQEADYQSPEGFYSVSAKQLHPRSNYYRAFNVGYPNAFDRQNGRTGGLVMVHGACKSVGCFAMTDRGIAEIYGFVEAALRAGQKEVQVHIFPFRMTEQMIARETGGGWLAFVAGGGNYAQWTGFWRNLKEGYDIFEQTGEPPVAFACGDRYAFGGGDSSCRRIAGW